MYSDETLTDEQRATLRQRRRSSNLYRRTRSYDRDSAITNLVTRYGSSCRLAGRAWESADDADIPVAHYHDRAADRQFSAILRLMWGGAR